MQRGQRFAEEACSSVKRRRSGKCGPMSETFRRFRLPSDLGCSAEGRISCSRALEAYHVRNALVQLLASNQSVAPQRA